jgi:hypothetical protein
MTNYSLRVGIDISAYQVSATWGHFSGELLIIPKSGERASSSERRTTAGPRNGRSAQRDQERLAQHFLYCPNMVG